MQWSKEKGQEDQTMVDNNKTLHRIKLKIEQQ